MNRVWPACLAGFITLIVGSAAALGTAVAGTITSVVTVPATESLGYYPIEGAQEPLVLSNSFQEIFGSSNDAILLNLGAMILVFFGIALFILSCRGYRWRLPQQ